MHIFNPRITYFLLLFYLITLHLHTIIPILPNITMGLLFIAYLASTNRAKTLRLLNANRFLYALFLYILWYLISAFLLSANLKSALHNLQLQIPFFVFPFLYVQLDFSPATQQKIKDFFIKVVLSVALVELCYSLYRYLFLKGSINVFYTDQLTYLTHTHTTYFSMYLLLTFWFLIEKLNRIILLKAKFWGYLSLLIGISFLLYLLGSKIVLLMLSVSWILYFIALKKRIISLPRYIFIMVSVSLILFLWVAVFSVNMNRFRGVTEFKKSDYSDTRVELDQREKNDTTRWTTISFRFALFDCAWEAFKKNPIVGVGVGDMMDTMLKKYNEKHFYKAQEGHSRIHNTFLDVGLETGIIGVLLFFTALFILPFYQCWRHKYYIGCLLIGMLFLSFNFESYTVRFHYQLFFSFIFPFLSTFIPQKEE